MTLSAEWRVGNVIQQFVGIEHKVLRVCDNMKQLYIGKWISI